jgi:uncharacterized protein
MNPRRVHELMSQRFPAIMGASREWLVVADEKGLRFEVLAALIDDHVRTEEVLVEANRKTGDMLLKQAALEFVAAHVGQGEIRIANRDFNGFVVVAQSGVATGWTADESR